MAVRGGRPPKLPRTAPAAFRPPSSLGHRGSLRCPLATLPFPPEPARLLQLALEFGAGRRVVRRRAKSLGFSRTALRRIADGVVKNFPATRVIASVPSCPAVRNVFVVIGPSARTARRPREGSELIVGPVLGSRPVGDPRGTREPRPPGSPARDTPDRAGPSIPGPGRAASSPAAPGTSSVPDPRPGKNPWKAAGRSPRQAPRNARMPLTGRHKNPWKERNPTSFLDWSGDPSRRPPETRPFRPRAGRDSHAGCDVPATHRWHGRGRHQVAPPRDAPAKLIRRQGRGRFRSPEGNGRLRPRPIRRQAAAVASPGTVASCRVHGREPW